MDKSSVARLLRCSWEAVDAIVGRVVADHIDDKRLDCLVRIGVDDTSAPAATVLTPALSAAAASVIAQTAGHLHGRGQVAGGGR